jgi:uncharacterized protein
MSTGNELKIVFTGPMGAGKTTAIAAISDRPPVSTDVANHDRASFNKESTTVALDYGELLLEGGTSLKLYGTPGQGRFGFMWDIVGRGALGVILLLDASSPSVERDLHDFLHAFGKSGGVHSFVVGAGRLQEHELERLESLTQCVLNAGVVAPVFAVDVRQREDVLLLVDTLLCQLEASAVETVSESAQ